VNTPVAQQEAMLEFVLLAAAEESPRPFPEPVVEALRRVVPCDTVAYRAWGRDGIVDQSYAADDLGDRWPVWVRYPAFRHDDPHPSEPPVRSGDPPPVSAPESMARPLLLRQAVSERRFWQTGLYFELMRPFGVRDVMKVFLPGHRGGGSVIVFDTSAHGFGEHDCAAVERLVPALVRFERNARLRSTARSGERIERLTPRELVVLGRVAAGETNAEIARALVVGPSTVRKHLEHIYDKLEVRNRAAAAALYSRNVRRDS
jgi:DNA-binding CsgD family transcriptional regulator